MSACKFCPLFNLPPNNDNLGLVIDALVEVVNLLLVNYHPSK